MKGLFSSRTIQLISKQLCCGPTMRWTAVIAVLNSSSSGRLYVDIVIVEHNLKMPPGNAHEGKQYIATSVTDSLNHVLCSIFNALKRRKKTCNFEFLSCSVFSLRHLSSLKQVNAP